MKKKFLILGFFLVFSSFIYADSHILYKDFTGFHSYLICCNDSNCITYTDYMTKNDSGWELAVNPVTHCYEIKNSLKEIDFFDLLMGNVSLIISFIIIVFSVGMVIKWLVKRE